MLNLHKFIVAVARIEVDHDGYGGTALHAMIWVNGSILKRRFASTRVVIDLASLPGHWVLEQLVVLHASLHPITHEDVAVLALQCEHPH